MEVRAMAPLRNNTRRLFGCEYVYKHVLYKDGIKTIPHADAIKSILSWYISKPEYICYGYEDSVRFHMKDGSMVSISGGDILDEEKRLEDEKRSLTQSRYRLMPAPYDEEYRHRTQLNSRSYSLAVNGLPAQDIVPGNKVVTGFWSSSPFENSDMSGWSILDLALNAAKNALQPAPILMSPTMEKRLRTMSPNSLFNEVFVTKCDKCGLGGDICDGKVNRKGRCTRQEGLFWEKVGKLTKTRQGNNKTAL